VRINAFSSPLKLPAAGYRNRATNDNGTIHNSGSGIFLWSRSVDGSQASALVRINAPLFTGLRLVAIAIVVAVPTIDSCPSFRCIKTRTPIVFNGLTYEMVTSPKTGRVWLDRNHTINCSPIPSSVNKFTIS
jgi:hypothetical protein